ncbi:MAG: DUF4855 domain-containing protein [Muribaculaceae bacterium]|nr:DUF4855 domain-containing protein [Muribaculaceae bacterium]
MSIRTYLTAIGLAATAFAASAYTEFNRYATDETSDLALIYSGSDRRPDWNSDNLMPYVVHTYADGTKDWFFDAFLVLEFTSGSTDKGFQNGVGKNFADKTDWINLLDKQFATIASLDSAIAQGKATIGEPRLRHKAVLGIPAPIKAQGTQWGEINGERLDFGNTEDRIKAAKWYVSEIVKRNYAQPFDNIDLTGIYWIEEGLYTNDEVVPVVNDWIYRNCLRSYWIPYYPDNEQFKWNWHDKYGFDIAYQQPNYFFDRSVPKSRLEDACDESKRYGLGLEMEFETQGTSRLQHDDPDSYFTRLEDYIDVFEKKGVFDEAAVAWYSGTKGYLDLARSSDPKNHEIADRMARIVAKRQKAKAESLKFPVDPIRDLALIWHGADRRIEWNAEQFEPYVAHTFADGSKNWLFDGFVFLEGDLDGKIRFITWVNYEGATKADWQEYLDRLFADGRGIDALNKCIENLKGELGNPPFRHKLEVMIPVAVCGNKHWGEIDGRALDFDIDADREAAAKWYIDQVIERFNKGGYNNLDLYGIYYLDEDLIHTKDYPKCVEPYVHHKGLQFSWIPYFKGRGYERREEMGFDIAYMQPGHFFEWTKPDKRLDEAIDVAKRYGFGMEFECDSEALSQFPNSKMERMQAYIDAFTRHGVWDNSAVAWYTGSKCFLDMKNQPSPENQAMMDQVARIIVNRRYNPNLVPTSK